MKHWISCLLMLLVVAASAQHDSGLKKKRRGNQTAEEVAKNKTDKLALRIGLNPDQKKKVYDICVKSLKERQALLPMKQTNKTEFESKIKKLEEDGYKQILAVLTPDQVKKVEKLKAEAAAKGGANAF